MALYRNSRRGQVNLGPRRKPMQPGEVRELSDEDVAEIIGERGVQAWWFQGPRAFLLPHVPEKAQPRGGKPRPTPREDARKRARATLALQVPTKAPPETDTDDGKPPQTHGEGAQGDTDTDTDTGKAKASTADLKAAEAIEYVGLVEDAEELRAIAASDERKTVRQAVEERLRDLETLAAGGQLPADPTAQPTSDGEPSTGG